MATGSGSYYGVGVTSGIPGYFLSSRIYGLSGGFGVITVKIEPHQIDEVWREASRNIFVSNGDGVILMSNNHSWLYQSIGELSSTQRAAIAEQKQFSHFENNQIVNDRYDFLTPDLKFWEIDDHYYLINTVALDSSSEFEVRHLVSPFGNLAV